MKNDAIINTLNTKWREPFEKFVDWRQCTAVMQSEAVAYMYPTYSKSFTVLFPSFFWI